MIKSLMLAIAAVGAFSIGSLATTESAEAGPWRRGFYAPNAYRAGYRAGYVAPRRVHYGYAPRAVYSYGPGYSYGRGLGGGGFHLSIGY